MGNGCNTTHSTALFYGKRQEARDCVSVPHRPIHAHRDRRTCYGRPLAESFVVPVRLLANSERPSSVSANRLCEDARGSARLKSLRRSKSDSAFCDV